jgi:hypothetical protein
VLIFLTALAKVGINVAPPKLFAFINKFRDQCFSESNLGCG